MTMTMTMTMMSDMKFAQACYQCGRLATLASGGDEESYDAMVRVIEELVLLRKFVNNLESKVVSHLSGGIDQEVVDAGTKKFVSVNDTATSKDHVVAAILEAVKVDRAETERYLISHIYEVV